MVTRQRVAPSLATAGSAAAERVWLVAVAAIVSVVALLLPHEPDRVDLTMQNPTDYLLYISASTPDDTTMTPVAIISPRTAVEVTDVIDRGADWVLHVRAPGVDAGVLAVARTDLLDGTYTIPAAIGDQLVADGVVTDVELARVRGR